MKCKYCVLVNDCLRVAELNGTVLDIEREHSCRCCETEFKALQRAGVRKARTNYSVSRELSE